MASLETIGRCCPNLRQLWMRCNTFNGSLRPLDNGIGQEHPYFTRLTTLYFRVGETNLDMPHLTPVALNYVLRNCGSSLRELIVPTRAAAVANVEYMADLLTARGLTGLEKLMLLLPGINDSPGALRLDIEFARFVLDHCKLKRPIHTLADLDYDHVNPIMITDHFVLDFILILFYL
jgi:hypothetical protein